MREKILREKINEISVFETFLCIFVIYIHVASEGLSNYIKPSIISLLVYTSSKMVAFVVPAFIFSSGLKALYKYSSDKSFNYIKFMIERLKRIYLPYLICVIGYYLYFVFRLHYFDFNIGNLLEYIFYGSLVAHFYFIVTIMQFYWLMPLWHKMCEKIPFIISFTVSLAITVFMRVYLTNILNNAGWRYSDRIFPFYLIFWVVGCYAGYNYKKFAEILSKFKPVLYFGAILLTVHFSMQYLNYCGFIYYKYGEYIHIAFCMIYAFAFYAIICDAMPFFTKFMKVFKPVSNAAFYIYLIHVIIIYECNYWLSIGNISSLTVRFVIRAICTYTASFGISLLYVYLKRRE